MKRSSRKNKPLSRLDLAADALGVLGLSPVQAINDPVRAMRVAATASLIDGNRFLEMVLASGLLGDAAGVTSPSGGYRSGVHVDLMTYDSEDEARLLLTGVLACFLSRLRETRRVSFSPAV